MRSHVNGGGAIRLSLILMEPGGPQSMTGILLVTEELFFITMEQLGAGCIVELIMIYMMFGV